MKTITQLWRLVRLGAYTFVAQLIAGAIASGTTNLTRAALIAAGVAAAEAVYRQAVPAGRTDGLLGNLIATYRLVKAGVPVPHPPAAPPPIAVEAPAAPPVG
ncbi:MAG TPA: hypothetical protein VHT75_04420 [Acidimicrobiales bacterium]|jgi:hypothetical protein|nr:hypothetical protein [Acidimicrobiales bacterium]